MSIRGARRASDTICKCYVWMGKRCWRVLLQGMLCHRWVQVSPLARLARSVVGSRLQSRFASNDFLQAGYFFSRAQQRHKRWSVIFTSFQESARMMRPMTWYFMLDNTNIYIFNVFKDYFYCVCLYFLLCYTSRCHLAFERRTRTKTRFPEWKWRRVWDVPKLHIRLFYLQSSCFHMNGWSSLRLGFFVSPEIPVNKLYVEMTVLPKSKFIPTVVPTDIASVTRQIAWKHFHTRFKSC